jgi:hypothetical protein
MEFEKTNDEKDDALRKHFLMLREECESKGIASHDDVAPTPIGEEMI